MDQLPEGIRLQRFPVGSARTRVYRWLAHRRITAGIVWYLGILLPVVGLIVLAAQVDDTLGLAALVLGGGIAVFAQVRLRRSATDCRDLMERVATVRDTRLTAGSHVRLDLHAGRTVVLEPGGARRYGQAHLLAVDGRACLLLSDPCTGQPRPAGELRVLVEVLQRSPSERDRDTARAMSALAAPGTEPDPGGDGAAPLRWRVVDALGWTVLVWAVTPILMFAAALVVQPAGQREGATGQTLVLIGLALLGIWVLSVFAHVAVWIGTTWIRWVGGGSRSS